METNGQTVIITALPFMIGISRKGPRFLAVIQLNQVVFDTLEEAEVDMVENDLKRRLSQKGYISSEEEIVTRVMNAIKELYSTKAGKHYPWLEELQVSVQSITPKPQNGNGK